MPFIFLLSLAGLTSLVASQGEPISWIDVNPPAQQDTIVHIQGTVTSYVGPTDYLSVVTETGTLSGALATVTASLEFTAVTATVASENDMVGDVDIVITPKLHSSWSEFAAKHCGAAANRTVRRDFSSCALDYASDAAPDAGAFDLIGPPVLPTVAAADIAAVISQVLATGRVVASSQGVATLSLIALAVWFENGQKDMPNALKIPAAQAQPATATMTSSQCPPQKTDGPSDAVCQDSKNCEGDANNLCTIGKYKGCPCVEALDLVPYDGWMDLVAQQSILLAWAAEAAKASSTPSATATAKTPSCSGGTIAIDPVVATKLVDVFCDTADLTKDTSKTVDGSDVNPPVTIANNYTIAFHYRPFVPSTCNETVQSCKDIYSSIIGTCQYNSHIFYGSGSNDGTCGNYGMTISDPSVEKTCSGPTADGNKECDTKCAPRTGTCVLDSTQPASTCSCN